MMKLADFSVNDINAIEQSGLGSGFVFKGGTIGSVISALLPLIFFAAGTILLIYLILGGLQYMTSRGDPKAIQGAQSKITAALIGFIIVFAAYWITQAVGIIFNIPQIRNIF